ncbi:hypothetical protein ACJX0J_035797, partial [Zea mays]
MLGMCSQQKKRYAITNQILLLTQHILNLQISLGIHKKRKRIQNGRDTPSFTISKTDPKPHLTSDVNAESWHSNDIKGISGKCCDGDIEITAIPHSHPMGMGTVGDIYSLQNIHDMWKDIQRRFASNLYI